MADDYKPSVETVAYLYACEALVYVSQSWNFEDFMYYLANKAVQKPHFRQMYEALEKVGIPLLDDARHLLAEKAAAEMMVQGLEGFLRDRP
jgi:hypothetical protein